MRTRFLAFGTVLAATIALMGSAPAVASDRPNIVFLVADDLGWNDVGYHGSEEIATPNLDRLAREGVRLDRFYVYPTCSPSRACWMSGRNASRFGIRGPIGLNPDDPYLPLETATLAAVLKPRGYATALVGKWHLGNHNAVGPRAQGFDTFYGYLHGQVDQVRHVSKVEEPIWMRNETLIEDEGHATDLFAREALAFIRDHREGPFFLNVCFSVPHYPVQDEPEWLATYENRIEHPDRRGFAAMVSHMDHAVGQILQTLDELDLTDNTLLVFLSDNGGQRDWQSSAYGGRHGPYERLGDNTPLRGWKGQLYEGGVRVVALARWPERLEAGTVFEGVAHACDLYPTFAAVAGASVPDDPPLDGINLWPLLTGQAEPPPRSFHWVTGSHIGILHGDYKLIQRTRSRPEDGEAPIELYNLADDPLETRNLADDQPEIVAHLEKRLDAELQRDGGMP